MKINYLIIILFLIPLNHYGQVYNATGNLPTGIKWYQISSETVRVIFPQGLDIRAQRIANVVNFMSEKDTNSIGKIIKTIDIFLVNKTSFSNGFVTSSPYHSKFFTMPPQEPFGGTVDWIDLLSVHEYRHVMQMNNTNHGVSKWLRKIFGETLWTGAMFLAIPNWFWEGDAVVQETLLSSSGRGRLPIFKSRFIDVLNNENTYSYEKMRCGSYRDIVPNHYSLGYHMVDYGRRSFGNEIWGKCVKDAVSYKGLLWPFSKALKRYSGSTTKDLYYEMTVKTKVDKPIIDSVNYIYESLTANKTPTFYSFPKFKNSNELYVVKSTFDDVAKLVKINLKNDFQEEDIIPISFNFGHYDISKKYLVWDEIHKDPRWDYVSYSNIYRKNNYSDEVVQLTKNTKYFSPSISPNGKRLAVVEVEESMTYKLLILDIQTGDVIIEIKNENNYFFRNIDWINENELVVIANKENKNAIISYDINSNNNNIFIPFSTTTFYDLSVTNKKVLFSSHFINNEHSLCIYNIKNKEVFVNKKGSYQPRLMPTLSIDGKLAFCDKTFNNTILKIGNIDEDVTFEKIETESNDNLGKLTPYEFSKSSNKKSILDVVPNQKFEVDEYNPTKHLLNFHSWIPKLVDPNYSLVFQSNDKLDKMSFSIEPTYNSNDKSFTLNTGLTFAGWYPILYLGLSPRVNIHHTRILDGVEKKYVSNIGQIKSTVRIPWNFARLNYQKVINTRFDFYGYKYFSSTDKTISNNFKTRLDFELSFVDLIKSSYRSIYPKYGLDARIKLYALTVDKGPKMLSGNFRMFLPGLVKNHSFRFRIGYFSNFHSTSISEISLGSSDYYFARGSDIRHVDKMVGGLKLNYSFPMIYPDFALDKFAFIKRIRTNLFFDVDRFDGFTNQIKYKRTTGIEFIFDNVYFRSVQIPVGIGIDYLFDTENNISPINFRLIVDI